MSFIKNPKISVFICENLWFQKKFIKNCLPDLRVEKLKDNKKNEVSSANNNKHKGEVNLWQ